MQMEKDREDAKMMFEKFKVALQSSSSQMDSINRDKSTISTSIAEMKAKLQNVATTQSNLEVKYFE